MSETAKSAAERARVLLAAGTLTDPLLGERGRVAGAQPVFAPGGPVQSWFAPVVVDDLIAGYFRADPALADWRFSSFQRRPGTLDGCPPAALWLDEADIARRAAALARPGERAEAPILSFDRVPDRIAWAVRLVAPDGASRWVYVAGQTVWPGE
jgi:hypothetical protein